MQQNDSLADGYRQAIIKSLDPKKPVEKQGTTMRTRCNRHQNVHDDEQLFFNQQGGLERMRDIKQRWIY